MILVVPIGSAASSAESDPDAKPNQCLVYVGTYTGGNSNGIYLLRMNLDTGALTTAGLAGETVNPSFLAIHPSGRFLYSVNEISKFAGKSSGVISAFSISMETGTLNFLNPRASGGAGPCHLVVDKAGKHVLAANYGGGSVTVIPILDNGRVGEPSAFVQHKGSSINSQRQERPHAHGIYLDAANRFAFVPDLGLDKVLVYQFDKAKGTLTPNDPPFAAVKPGAGPRHFAFHPAGRYAYVINELHCTITAFSYDPDRGALKEFQTLSTLPGQVQSGYSTAEIEVHPTGEYLYGSNRGHDSIVVCSIDPKNGRLKVVEHESTQGETPRSFGIDPTGKFLLAANQSSDSIVVFRINPESGKLEPTGHRVETPKPVCVVFLPVK